MKKQEVILGLKKKRKELLGQHTVLTAFHYKILGELSEMLMEMPINVRESFIENINNAAVFNESDRNRINYAFCWAETPQGHDFWRKLRDITHILSD